MLKENDIVIVVDDDAIPSVFLGQYGRVTENFGHKVVVEIHAKVDGRKEGSMKHTALITDVQKVGEMIT